MHAFDRDGARRRAGRDEEIGMWVCCGAASTGLMLAAWFVLAHWG